jgi:biopolymer transport protein ExbD
MSRAAPPVVHESVSPNVVPLLDVMFLLMIFLMLGSDMSVRETADLQLPVADAAITPPDARPGRIVTLNVVRRGEKDWGYAMAGGEFGTDLLRERLAAVAGDSLEPPEPDGRRLSAVTLTIRGDRAAPYGTVQEALLACSAAGIHRTEVAAALPAPK